MEKKIRKNMIVISVLVALVTYICSGISLYLTILVSVDREVKNIASQITETLIYDEHAFEQMSVFSEARITLIGSDGMVIYDSIKGSNLLDNHLHRPEIHKAFETGEGKSLRFSDSQGTQTYYYAKRLSNGTCLRIATEMKSLNLVFSSGFTAITVVMVVMLAVAAHFSRKLTQNIIQPINQIDFNHPLDNVAYPELKPLLQNLERHEKMRKEFSANVSHELKTPLTSISGYAEIMANGLVKEEDIPYFSMKIYEESRNLFHKIEDILRISRLDEGHLPFQLEEVNYKIIVESVLEHLEPQIQKKKLTVQTSLMNVQTMGIVSVAEEIVFNLIENAVKYNRYNGLIRIVLSEDPNEIQLMVEDTGLGISEEELPRIFERFYRSDKSRFEQIEGSGLGLSIVKHGLLLLKGEISVKSKVNQGSKFTVVLKKHS